MCGRYVLFTDEEEDEITELVHEIQRRLDKENAEAQSATGAQTVAEAQSAVEAQLVAEAQSAAEAQLVAEAQSAVETRLIAPRVAVDKPLRISGEVFPTQCAPVLTADGPTAMCWGLPSFKGSGVIINARAESVFEKSFFRQAMYNRRLVILSHGFFEWRKPSGSGSKDRENKEKLLFNRPGERRLYMAGLYNPYADGARFAILTTAANDAMKPIHHRMPVILAPSEVTAYLSDEKAARAIITRVPPALDFAAV